MEKPLHDSAECPGKTAGRPKAADVEARTQELLQVAGRLFLENGYTKTSLESIARAAHVAVRTIYVKFGGKAGLLDAVLFAKRHRFFRSQPMEADDRPFREVVGDFARQMHELINSQEAVEMQRIVLAEASTNPELAEAFWNGGPHQTRDMLARYLARPSVRAQLRPDLPFDLLPAHMMAVICGEQMKRFLGQEVAISPEVALAELEQRMELFYRSVLLGN
ncbi:TetR/AcrR family transcriptional regulator [Massilia sp. YIM B02763]|uniref:TetR/AcrR family transcriptional regulator n=1 Tax=Massilia sp. YIM B02763 TaxID=3050130 RepID=UPI0025B67EA6|nr:TetR/AcrR family transcriptional regulator [Massilia sp. YIM B02763]MDN4055727.1 TetR/AcrR family transcriptional regulator [Massilia sp. YIM B02763]